MNRLIIPPKIEGQKSEGGKDEGQHLGTWRAANGSTIHQQCCVLLIGTIMIAVQIGRQWSFVESLRDEAQLNRGLSHASTRAQSVKR